MTTALGIAYDVLLTAGVVLLGIGFFWKDVRAHLVRAAGWSVFGVFWFLHVADYVDQEDALNALRAAVALPVFLFVAFHDRLSYRWREEYDPLRFACGPAFFASAVYFAFARIPELAAGLVQVVADETATLLTWMGYPFAAGPPTCGGAPGTIVAGCENGEAGMVGLFPPPKPTEPLVNIVLACTPPQAHAGPSSLMLSDPDPWRREAPPLGVRLPL